MKLTRGSITCDDDERLANVLLATRADIAARRADDPDAQLVDAENVVWALRNLQCARAALKRIIAEHGGGEVQAIAEQGLKVLDEETTP